MLEILLTLMYGIILLPLTVSMIGIALVGYFIGFLKRGLKF